MILLMKRVFERRCIQSYELCRQLSGQRRVTSSYHSLAKFLSCFEDNFVAIPEVLPYDIYEWIRDISSLTLGIII